MCHLQQLLMVEHSVLLTLLRYLAGSIPACCTMLIHQETLDPGHRTRLGVKSPGENL